MSSDGAAGREALVAAAWERLFRHLREEAEHGTDASRTTLERLRVDTEKHRADTRALR